MSRETPPEPHGEADPEGLPTGSWLYRNWREALGGAPERAAWEYPLYSDSRFSGHDIPGLGPYKLLNTLGFPHEPGSLHPVL
jgi:hypothetical protein